VTLTHLGGLAVPAAVSLLAWLWLALFHGRFWRADQVLAEGCDERASWPEICAVIPARNEAATIGAALRSLLEQDYPGAISVVVVDDDSDDGTAGAARAAAQGDTRLHVVSGAPLPAGWTGKLWAVSQGVDHAARVAPDATFLLLTDADIAHDRLNLRRLVVRAEDEGRELVSLMVRLVVGTFWERLLIPAFVFFFQKLYPFPRVNNPRGRVAAAAGGCMLLRRSALARIGGIEAIRGEVIDDCALARAIKRSGGSIWLGLTETTCSLRGYGTLAGIWNMVARSAYVQLRHSVVLLAGTLAGMILLYLVPPLAFVAGIATSDPVAALAGGGAWAVMTVLYGPTLALYGQPSWRAALLPAAAALYCAMTVTSAWRTWRGRGAGWKGRHYAPRARIGE
jgi:hopene-associated glycosyltransferase HpnB